MAGDTCPWPVWAQVEMQSKGSLSYGETAGERGVPPVGLSYTGMVPSICPGLGAGPAARPVAGCGTCSITVTVLLPQPPNTLGCSVARQRLRGPCGAFCPPHLTRCAPSHWSRFTHDGTEARRGAVVGWGSHSGWGCGPREAGRRAAGLWSPQVRRGTAGCGVERQRSVLPGRDSALLRGGPGGLPPP